MGTHESEKVSDELSDLKYLNEGVRVKTEKFSQYLPAQRASSSSS